MKRVAVVMDGGFVRITFQKFFRETGFPEPQQVTRLATAVIHKDEELFRIYYYDCPPFEKELERPVSRELYKKTEMINAGKRYIGLIAAQDRVAYRSGELKFSGWTLKTEKLRELMTRPRPVNDDDFRPIFKQKRIDMKIGLDIAWLSIRRIVDRIILVAGDSDFVPAMKLARIEGIQIVLVPLGNPISRDMREHSDEVREIHLGALFR